MLKVRAVAWCMAVAGAVCWGGGLAQARAVAPTAAVVEVTISTSDPLLQEAKTIFMTELKSLVKSAGAQVVQTTNFSGKTLLTVGGPGEKAKFTLDLWPVYGSEEYLTKALAPVVALTGKRPLVVLSAQPLPGLAAAAQRVGLPAPLTQVPKIPSVVVVPWSGPGQGQDLQALRKSGHAVVSFPGLAPLKAGALAGLQTDVAGPAARRLALDVWRALRGQSLTSTEELLEHEPLLVLNRRTMTQLGLRPPLTLLLRAEPRDVEPVATLKVFSMKQALSKTLAHAPERKASGYLQQASHEEEKSVHAQRQVRVTGVAQGQTLLGEDRGQSAVVRLDAVKVLTQRGNRHQAHQAALTRELAGLSGVALTLRLKALTAQRYLDVLEHQEKLLLQEEQLSILRRNLRVAEDRVAVGVAAPEEAGRQRIQAENTLYAVSQAQEALAAARLALAQLTGEAVPEEALWDTSKVAMPALKALTPMLEPLLVEKTRERVTAALVARTVQTHPNFAVLRTREALAHAAERVIKASATPVLQAESSVSQEDSLTTNDRTDWTAGVRLTVPLYAGHRDRYARQARLAEAQAQAENLVSQREVLGRDVGVLLSRLVQSWQSAGVLEAAAGTAAENLQAVEARYGQGVLPLINLLDAERDWVTTRTRAISERHAFFHTLASLFEQVGQPDLVLEPATAAVLKKFFTPSGKK